jgi:PAS domain S-box-containing protein
MQTKLQRNIIVLIITALTTGIFLADCFTPRVISDWVWYFVPLLLLIFVRNSFSPFSLAVILSVLIVAGYFVSPTGTAKWWMPLVNRSMAICVIWLVAWALSRLQKTEERLRTQSDLLDLAHDAILVCDLEDGIVYWNKSAERLYGWAARDIFGEKSLDILSKGENTFTEAKRIVLQKGEWSGELVCHAKDGHEVIVDARWTLVRDHHGVPKSILSINTDITEKQKLQQQLFRAQRLESIGTLAGGIAHDLNNILTPLMMSANMLKEKITDAEMRELVQSLETNVQRGADMVKQVLTFGRGTAGERVAINPARIVREVERIVRETFPKSLQLESDVEPDIWTMTGDVTQLHQVLLNLCLNARDAMPNGGKLSVIAENAVLDETYVQMHLEARIGPHVVIRVTDTGAGIPLDLQEKTFEPFFTTKPGDKGSGLGLSNVRSIVKSHGGFVNFYSEVGKGSTFKVYMPASATQAAAEVVAVEQTKLPRGKNELVLVVDDEEAIRNTAKKVLERFGYRTLLAGNGAQAVSIYAEHKNEIAVVITDMAMPVMDGIATIVALKSINPAVKIIGSSGLEANGNVTKAVGHGIHHFVPKPYTTEALLRALDEVLHKNISA